jgi:hypothetical protein
MPERIARADPLRSRERILLSDLLGTPRTWKR